MKENGTDKSIRCLWHFAKGFKILLTLKRAGPYQGLWDLPGGGIEFGETSEQALKRELLEEVSTVAERFELLYHFTATGGYKKRNTPYRFHHVGVIYNVLNWKVMPDSPQEESQWIALNSITFNELTPFAREAVSYLLKSQSWRPTNTIRGKAIGIAKQNNRILVCEVLNDEGVLKGWVPFLLAQQFRQNNSPPRKLFCLWIERFYEKMQFFHGCSEAKKSITLEK